MNFQEAVEVYWKARGILLQARADIKDVDELCVRCLNLHVEQVAAEDLELKELLKKHGEKTRTTAMERVVALDKIAAEKKEYALVAEKARRRMLEVAAKIGPLLGADLSGVVGAVKDEEKLDPVA